MNKLLSVGLIIVVLSANSTIVNACTGFTASNEQLVLAGNNEDLSLLAEPKLRIIPPSGGNYGRIVFYCKWPFPFETGTYSAFGGMNDQGLFFDIFSTPYLRPTNPLNKPTYTQDIFDYCIRTCATVDEVVQVFNQYYITYMDEIQGFFVDRTGNAVIIEGDDIIYKQGECMVVTNFLQTHPELGGYPCWRYATVTSMLENMTELSVDYFRDICEAAHVEQIPLQEFTLDTIYSNVCDITNGVMYLYFFHDYTKCVELRIPEVFEQGYQSYDIASLFTTNSSHPPNKPAITSGQSSGTIYREYEYSAMGTDDDGDKLFYMFDWGDGTTTGWVGYHEPGMNCTVSHMWTETGTYEIKVKTKDVFGYESEWSDPLPLRMPMRHHTLLELIISSIFRILVNTMSAA